jgi:hypothetical protein
MGAVTLLLLLFLVLHGTAARFDRADKHGIVTALRADVIHFLVLPFAFAGADDRDGTAANAFVLLTDPSVVTCWTIMCLHLLQAIAIESPGFRASASA